MTDRLPRHSITLHASEQASEICQAYTGCQGKGICRLLSNDSRTQHQVAGRDGKLRAGEWWRKMSVKHKQEAEDDA